MVQYGSQQSYAQTMAQQPQLICAWRKFIGVSGSEVQTLRLLVAGGWSLGPQRAAQLSGFHLLSNL